MQIINRQSAQGANQPGLITWKTIPDFIQQALTAQGCTLLNYHREQPDLAHIRFQYVPLAYQGDLYYLQRWSDHEWGVSPSQIIFPTGTACSLAILSSGNLLSSMVKARVAKFYGDFPHNTPFHPSSATKPYMNGKMLPLAG